MAFWQARFGTAPACASVAAYDPQLAAEVVTAELGGLGREALPDILVCENDALAIGAMDVIRHRLGWRVPEDIAVIGFDDIPAADSLNYRLTSYRQPVAEMAGYLVDVLESREDRDFTRLFTGSIIRRESA